MKIGILSMQRIVNYGSFLQAYALKKVLEKPGHQVTFVDIVPGRQLYPEQIHKPSNKLLEFLKKLFNFSDEFFFQRISNALQNIVFHALFTKKWLPELGVSQQSNPDEQLDLVVIGSDEVFNFIQHSSWGFSPQLFSHGINAKKVISYAASFGFSTYTDVTDNHLEEEMRSYLTNFSDISVRDANSYQIIQNILGKPPRMDIDPTILYEFGSEIPALSVPYKYLILYSYQGRTNTPAEVARIKDFAKEKKLKVISIGTFHPWVDKNIIANPFELLAYFKNADYIVTDTFHGSIFAIIMQKQFYTIIRNSNSEKLTSLLAKFGLQAQSSTSIDKLSEALLHKIDYEKVAEIIQHERESSLAYLNGYIR